MVQKKLEDGASVSQCGVYLFRGNSDCTPLSVGLWLDGATRQHLLLAGGLVESQVGLQLCSNDCVCATRDAAVGQAITQCIA